MKIRLAILLAVLVGLLSFAGSALACGYDGLPCDGTAGTSTGK